MSHDKLHADHTEEFNDAIARFDAAAAKEDEATPEAAEAPEAAKDGREDSEAHDDAQDGQDGHDEAEEDGRAPNREAAKYRRRLRDAEKERDELRQRLDVYLARDVETVAAGFLDAPALLWADGQATAADFLDEKGSVDRAKVRAAAEAILERYGRGLASRRGTAPNEGRTRASASGPFYRDAFAPKREI